MRGSAAERRAHIRDRVKQAAGQGADLVTLPEIWNGPYQQDLFPSFAEPRFGPSWQLLSELAAEYGIWLSGGSIAECDNGKEDNCLVITDSFGLAFVPMVTQNYKQVHYYDPRYFDKNTVGGSVADMIRKYNIKDVYVVVGDLHSYSSGFLINQLSKQLGDQ